MHLIPKLFVVHISHGTSSWNLVISNNTRSWRPYEKIIPAGLIWGNTVFNFSSTTPHYTNLLTYCSAHFADLQRLWVTVRAKRKEKRFAQNWRIFRSNYAKCDNLNMPRIWREFSGNFLYWQNLRWQKISNRKFDLFLLFEPPLVIFFSYLLSKQNKNTMNNAGGYQNGFFFSHILMTFCNFKVCHNRRYYFWLGQKNHSFGHIFTRPPGISHVQFIFNLLHTDNISRSRGPLQFSCPRSRNALIIFMWYL